MGRVEANFGRNFGRVSAEVRVLALQRLTLKATRFELWKRTEGLVGERGCRDKHSFP